jgi:hypothetical protein
MGACLIRLLIADDLWSGDLNRLLIRTHGQDCPSMLIRPPGHQLMPILIKMAWPAV